MTDSAARSGAADTAPTRSPEVAPSSVYDLPALGGDASARAVAASATRSLAASPPSLRMRQRWYAVSAIVIAGSTKQWSA